MALTKDVIIDKIELVGEYRIMQLREAIVIKENGVEIARSLHRRTLEPDADTAQEDAEITALSSAIWTPSIKAAHATAKAAARLKAL